MACLTADGHGGTRTRYIRPTTCDLEHAIQPEEYDVMRAVEDDHWWYRALRRVVRTHLDTHVPHWKTAAILDAGCGTGANLELLGPHGVKVGLDISARALGHCRQRGLRTLVRGSVTEIPLGTGSMDAVVSTSVLYHLWVSSSGAALREFHRVLKPDGVLVLDLPAWPWLTSEHDTKVMTRERFTPAQVNAALQDAGFVVLAMNHWNVLPLPGVLAARVLNLGSGRDFGGGVGARLRNRVMDGVMAAEHRLLRRVHAPVGVSLSAVARRAT